MDKTWIIDTLSDLETFAELNDLTALARSLRDAKAIAQLPQPRPPILGPMPGS